MRARYLLDTSVWLRMIAAPQRLNARVLGAVQREEALALSAFSILEVLQAHARRRLIEGSVEAWLDAALPLTWIRPLPVNSTIVARAYELEERFPGDWSDRVIAATALHHRLTLVTADRALLAYSPLNLLSACGE